MPLSLINKMYPDPINCYTERWISVSIIKFPNKRMSRSKWNAYVCVAQGRVAVARMWRNELGQNGMKNSKAIMPPLGISSTVAVCSWIWAPREIAPPEFSVAHFFGDLGELLANRVEYLPESKAKMRKIRLLQAFQPYFRTLQIYNPENFTQSDRLKNLQNFGFTVVVTAFVALIPNTILQAIWLLIEHDAPMRKLVIAIPLLLTLLYTLIAYIVLALRNRAIGGTIGELQSVIDQRGSLANKYRQLVSKVCNDRLPLPQLGCQDSKHSFDIYSSVESKHASITAFMRAAAIAIVVVVFLLSAMFPISHAVFDYPPPQLWKLPVETQLVPHNHNGYVVTIFYCGQFFLNFPPIELVAGPRQLHRVCRRLGRWSERNRFDLCGIHHSRISLCGTVLSH